MEERATRIRLAKHDDTGLLAATSEDLLRLVVFGKTVEEIERKLPMAIRELLEASHEQVGSVTVVPDDIEFHGPDLAHQHSLPMHHWWNIMTEDEYRAAIRQIPLFYERDTGDGTAMICRDINGQPVYVEKPKDSPTWGSTRGGAAISRIVLTNSTLTQLPPYPAPKPHLLYRAALPGRPH